jgi:hypothetical protein
MSDMTPDLIQPPRVNPVGISESPEGYHATPRQYPRAVRVGAALILGAFLAVSLTTSAYSLATYCLTTYAGVPFPSLH